MAASHDAVPPDRCEAGAVTMRCLIVDDNLQFLEAARVLLEREGMTVVGTATTSAEALRLAEEMRPEVVLVDVRLGEESGVELSRRLPGTVILISTQTEAAYTEELARSTAVGFIPKDQLSAGAIRLLLGARGE
jgi:two-component system, NarL family, nitrate/nitrite response regulator NarL